MESRSNIVTANMGLVLAMAKKTDFNEKDACDVVGIVDDLLEKAALAGASDIHFEPTGGQLSVRFRLDGVLSPVESLPAALADNVVARLKVGVMRILCTLSK